MLSSPPPQDDAAVLDARSLILAACERLDEALASSTLAVELDPEQVDDEKQSRCGSCGSSGDLEEDSRRRTILLGFSWDTSSGKSGWLGHAKRLHELGQRGRCARTSCTSG